jgi:hypothetical protein
MKFGMFLAPQLPYAVKLEESFVQAMSEAKVSTHFFDLDLAFRENNIDTTAILEGNDDGHWNAVGHRETAILLERYLQDQGLLE